ncbi:MAG: gamma-butyrobetaine,2-oxoglutarate dioxygenase [Acidimicrobiales bacterium]|nr:gamma-butyrobetaine,2-oxoglutarate dioxygenase [Acidimicrobiales bacterium]RZV45890.1 MAG: gamma-butyrobetaine,2-oxoglutarate dioxygenase [Acidimicrobiales bacterium]
MGHEPGGDVDNTTQDPLTPDFYDYPFDALSSVERDGAFLVLRWADGCEYRAFDRWLRENAVDRGGVHLATREGVMDPAHFAAGLVIGEASIVDGALVVRFDPEGVEASFHPGWLRHVAEGRHLTDTYIPNIVAWRPSDFGGEPPSYDGAEVMDDEATMRFWINDLLRYGLARLRNCPTEEDFLLEFAAKVGAVRDTNFGHIWDVKADVTMAGDDLTNSTANTNLRLPPHTDLPTRETPPGFQFLHCVVNETQGGNSTMADGAAVAAELEANHPEHYEALTTLKWVFFNRGPNIDHRWSGPMIDLGVDGSPLTFRAFHPVRGFPDMDQSDMPRAYAAMAAFSSIAASPEFEMSYPFAAGDIVGFDNRRVLHGRDQFSSGGKRHLRGIYIDQDEVRSFARVANRRHEFAQSTNQPQGDHHA